MRNLAAACLLVLLSACGGGGSSFVPLPTVQAQPAEAPPIIGNLHFILRPDENGKWHVQNDETHKSIGVVQEVVQTDTFIRVNFIHVWKYAGTVQVSSDDGFASKISGHANLGTTAMEISIHANGARINPAHVWHHAQDPGNGNLWVNVSMVD